MAVLAVSMLVMPVAGSSQTPEPDMPFQEFKFKRLQLIQQVRVILGYLCRPIGHVRFGHQHREISPTWRDENIRWWERRYERASAKRSRCLPEWFRSWARCIAKWESGGSNSWAGYFGFIYPPSAYIWPGDRIARQYGNSWYNVPYRVQLTLVWALYKRYGTSPWTTAGRC